MLNIDRDSGLLREANYQASPNCDDRPSVVEPELLVVHSISLPPGEYGAVHICEFFQNKLDIQEHEYFEHRHADAGPDPSLLFLFVKCVCKSASTVR